MPDYLARKDAPLSEDDWEKIDKVVVESARKRLVGRRFISITGPLGVGMQVIQSPVLDSIDEGVIQIKGKENLNIPLIYKDFKLNWRDIETAKQFGAPLELGPAMTAAASCALREDEIVFNGYDEYGYKGLTNTKGRTTVEVQDWSVSGNAFQNVVSAIEKLTSGGFYGPYAMVVSPSLYALMHRVMDGTGMLEITVIRELVKDGVFQSPVIKEKDAIVMATGAENFDLVIGQDMITAYLGPDGMDHPFRVFETVLLRIKRPGSICSFSVK